MNVDAHKQTKLSTEGGSMKLREVLRVKHGIHSIPTATTQLHKTIQTVALKATIAATQTIEMEVLGASQRQLENGTTVMCLNASMTRFLL